MNGFQKAIEDCNLIDLGFVGEMYTWEKSGGSVRWVQERLDRGMANKAWKNLFPAAEVRVLEVSTSDHLPLFLNLNRHVFMPREK